MWPVQIFSRWKFRPWTVTAYSWIFLVICVGGDIGTHKNVIFFTLKLFKLILKHSRCMFWWLFWVNRTCWIQCWPRKMITANCFQDTGTFTGFFDEIINDYKIHTLCISFERKFDCNFDRAIIKGHLRSNEVMSKW